MYKVLLVDDEPIIVEGLSRSIPWERWNCRVVATANDGTEGKNLIEKERPDNAISGTHNWSSEKEHKADALALGADEGRDKLRKAAGRSKYLTIRRCPNGGTQL